MVMHYKLSMYYGAYQSNLECQAWGMFLCQLYFHCLCTGSWFHCSCEIFWHQLKIYVVGFIFPFNAVLIKEITLKSKTNEEHSWKSFKDIVTHNREPRCWAETVWTLLTEWQCILHSVPQYKCTLICTLICKRTTKNACFIYIFRLCRLGSSICWEKKTLK